MAVLQDSPKIIARPQEWPNYTVVFKNRDVFWSWAGCLDIAFLWTLDTRNKTMIILEMEKKPGHLFDQISALGSQLEQKRDIFWSDFFLDSGLGEKRGIYLIHFLLAKLV